VILRDASSDDEEALQRLDVGGPSSPWLDEVSEIVSGLLAWRDDDQRRDLDRRVIVAVEGDEMLRSPRTSGSNTSGWGPSSATGTSCWSQFVLITAGRASAAF
jgi:hypothetical protein